MSSPLIRYISTAINCSNIHTVLYISSPANIQVYDARQIITEHKKKQASRRKTSTYNYGINMLSTASRNTSYERGAHSYTTDDRRPCVNTSSSPCPFSSRRRTIMSTQCKRRISPAKVEPTQLKTPYIRAARKSLFMHRYEDA